MSWLMRTTANGRTALPCKFLGFNSILNLILIDGLFSNHKSNSILGLNLLTLKTVYNKFLTYLSRFLFQSFATHKYAYNGNSDLH